MGANRRRQLFYILLAIGLVVGTSLFGAPALRNFGEANNALFVGVGSGLFVTAASILIIDTVLCH